MDEYDELDGNTEDEEDERRRKEKDDPLPMMIADDHARLSMEGREGCLAAALVVLAVALLTASAHANPSPPAEMVFHPFYWLLKTLPFNYAADFIALCLALLVFPQRFSIAWRRVPIYNLVVVAAGYTADWAGSAIAQYPTFRHTGKDPIMGSLLYNAGSAEFTFAAGVGFMAATALIIYLLNLAVIHGIFRLNDVSYRPRHLHLAAAIMAVLTSPYIALRGAAEAAWFVPVSLALLGIGAYRFAWPALNRRKQESPHGKLT